MTGRRAATGAALAALLALSGCGESKKPSVDGEAERAAATERAKQGPFGADVKALEDAKGLGADLNKKAEENLEKADK